MNNYKEEEYKDNNLKYILIIFLLCLNKSKDFDIYSVMKAFLE